MNKQQLLKQAQDAILAIDEQVNKELNQAQHAGTEHKELQRLSNEIYKAILAIDEIKEILN